MDDMYDILNFMTQDELWTHQLPRACRAVRPVILGRHPDLVFLELTVHKVCDRDQDLPDWLGKLRRSIIENRKGEDKVILEPMEKGTWEHKNTLVEACEMMGGKA